LINVSIIAPTLAERVGYKTLIESDSEIIVIADAPSLEEFDPADEEDSILLIMSDEISDEDNTSLLGLGRLELPVLIITEDRSLIRSIADSNISVWGILPPDASLEELTSAIKSIQEGLLVFPATFLSSLKKTTLFETQPGESEMIEPLTPREREVLELLAEGLANKQIALELDISDHTVKFHISSIYAKLGAASRTEAVRLGLQNGLITL
jgi:DNA-binding NarL/FixJ family response regulator